MKVLKEMDMKKIYKNDIKTFIDNRNLKENKWIIARGWDNDFFIDKNVFPTRYDLDEISTESQIYIIRACGYIRIAK